MVDRNLLICNKDISLSESFYYIHYLHLSNFAQTENLIGNKLFYFCEINQLKINCKYYKRNNQGIKL